MTSEELWLAAVWPFVRTHLPTAPATVVELGCGPFGGFVPMMRAEGHDAVGVDPEAPEGAGYSKVEFEEFSSTGELDAVVASLSLHHVTDLAEVLDRVTAALRPAGTVVVVEWSWERFDEATALWAFDRLPPPDGEPGWLHRRRDAWRDSGKAWDAYMRDWAAEDGVHAGDTVLHKLQERFDPIALDRGPYVFPSLDGISEADEQAAIDARLIQATRLRFVGRSR